MAWTERYHPPSLSPWRGRADASPSSCIFQTIQPLNLLESQRTSEPSIALLGFCCDEGVRRNLGRPGAAQGPQSIRSALGGIAVSRHEVTLYDAGDIVCEDSDLEASQTALAEAVSQLLSYNITPIVIGGGHEMAFGHYQGLARSLPSASLGIINFDAHFDMRPLLADHGSSGSPFLQMAIDHENRHRSFHYHCIGIQAASNSQALFETARQYQVEFIYAEALQTGSPRVQEFLAQAMTPAQLYVSLCLDVFAAAYAPGVSAPQALGVTPWQVIPLLRQLALSGKVVSYDIAELCPPFDIDAHTAKLAANLIIEIINHHHFGKKRHDNGTP